MSDGDKIRPPWNEATVTSLNAYQRAGVFHPFTCGNDRDDEAHRAQAQQSGDEAGLLVATQDGWRCPACNYKQGWAHRFMARIMV